MEKEKNITTKEKMTKNFNKCMVGAWAFRNLLILILVFSIIVLFVDIILAVINSGGDNWIQVIVQTIDEFTGEFFEEVMGGFVSPVKGNNKMYRMVYLLKYILIILFSDKIGRIFKVSIEEGTPFSNKNIKNMENITRLAWIYALLSSNGMVYEYVVAILMSSIYYIFKYGCELQQESDEIL